MNIGKVITGWFEWMFCSITLTIVIAIWYEHKIGIYKIGIYELIVALAVGFGIFIGRLMEAYRE